MVLGWIIYCVAVSALLSAAAVLLEVAARRMGRPVRWVWAVAMVSGVVIPVWAFFRPAAEGAAVLHGGAPPNLGVGVGEIYAIAGISAEAGGTPASMVDPLLLGAWGGASLVLLLFGCWSLLRLRRARSGWRRTVVDGVDVRLSSGTGPAVVGYLRPEIVLPRWVLDRTAAERSLILRHEREHLRARDPLLMIAGLVTAASLPWNLPLWWQLRRLRLAIELDCDARVVQRGGDLRKYASLLLDVGRRRAVAGRPVLAMAEPASFLERRIRTMTSPRGGRRWSVALASAAAATALVAGACAVEEPPQRSTALDQPPVTGPTADAVPVEPSFTPRDVDPSLLDVADFTRRLERLYPAELKEAGIGGRVLVWVFIDEEGAVGETRVQESSGHPSMDEAAMQALREARFSPATHRDEPVAVWVALPVVFHMDRPQAGAGPQPSQPARPAAPAAATPTGDAETARATEAAPAADPAQGLQREPQFTPREIDPRLQNRSEFTRLLAREYPTELRDAGVGGRVLVWVFVDEGGSVAQARVYESSGREALDEAALRAVRQAQFSPATNRGEVVPVWIAVPVTFQAPVE